MKFLMLMLFQLQLCSVFAQVIKVPLLNKKGDYGINSEYRKVTVLSNSSSYQGFDTLNYEKWVIGEIFFNNMQKLKEEVGKKNMPVIAYSSILKRNNSLDTASIFNDIIPKNSIGLFIAIKDHFKYIIVDKNGNKDFSDDVIYTFELNKEKVYPEIELEMDYYDGTSIKKTVLPFTIDSYVNISLNSDQWNTDVLLSDRSHKQGVYNDGQSKWTITLDNPHFFLYKNEEIFLCVDTVGKPESANDRYIYSSRDAIAIGKKIYTVKSVINDTLYLSYVAPYLKTKGELHTIAPEIIGEELITNKHFSLSKKRGQYVLLDFWGSWCKPCINLLPELVNIHSKYKNKGLQVVSVAFDNKKDIDKLKKLIDEHELTWEHLFVEREAAHGITKDYHVQIYPTTILIDPKGKVVVRGTGEDALIKVDKFLTDVN